MLQRACHPDRSPGEALRPQFDFDPALLQVPVCGRVADESRHREEEMGARGRREKQELRQPERTQVSIEETREA